MEVAVNVPLFGTDIPKVLRAFKRHGVNVMAYKMFISPVTGNEFFAGLGRYDQLAGIRGTVRSVANALGVPFISLSKDGDTPRMFFYPLDHEDDGAAPDYFERVESSAV